MEFLHRKTKAFLVIFTIICLFSKLIPSSEGSAICLGNPAGKNLTYHANAASLLSKLASISSTLTLPLSGYFNDSVGEAPDTAYGSYYCRGDLDTQLCHDCVDRVTQDLSKENASYLCFGYDDQCMVQLSDRPVYSLYRNGYVLSYRTTGRSIPDYDQYNKTLSTTLEDLVDEAALGNWARTNFETRVANVTGSDEKIYTLVQCSPDISATNCSSCLGRLSAYLPRCCGRSSGATVIHANCMLKYDNLSFFGGDIERSGSNAGFFPGSFHVFSVMLLSLYFVFKM